MNGFELTADRLAPDNGFEVTVKDGQYHVLFFYVWDRREAAYDGEGVGRTFEEAALQAIRDAEGEE